MKPLVPLGIAALALLFLSSGSSSQKMPAGRTPPPKDKDKAPDFKPPPDIIDIAIPGVDEPVKIDTPPAFESWQIARPAEFSQTPTLASGFSVGEDAWLVLKSKTSAVVARMVVLSVETSESGGPVAVGILKMLRPTAAFEQLEGTSVPALGSKVQLPIAYAVMPPAAT